ncbi:hypothetical protein DXV76_12385 [Rhodobacteraceae bacterium CCMM004]|nr:hypothetical protein DXV76_12385 [Rhodobacteraceae bacterium CCMM004]
MTPSGLVMGAGPTGLTAAMELTRLGHRATLIERRPDASSFSRAVGIQSGTIEILRPSGAAAGILDEAVRFFGVEIYEGARHLVSLPLGVRPPLAAPRPAPGPDRAPHRAGLRAARGDDALWCDATRPEPGRGRRRRHGGRAGGAARPPARRRRRALHGARRWTSPFPATICAASGPSRTWRRRTGGTAPRSPGASYPAEMSAWWCRSPTDGSASSPAVPTRSPRCRCRWRSRGPTTPAPSPSPSGRCRATAWGMFIWQATRRIAPRPWAGAA